MYTNIVFMLTVYNVYRMQQWRSIMYSIDKCVGIPDLSKHAAVPKREGGGDEASNLKCAYYMYTITNADGSWEGGR